MAEALLTIAAFLGCVALILLIVGAGWFLIDFRSTSKRMKDHRAEVDRKLAEHREKMAGRYCGPASERVFNRNVSPRIPETGDAPVPRKK